MCAGLGLYGVYVCTDACVYVCSGVYVHVHACAVYFVYSMAIQLNGLDYL